MNRELAMLNHLANGKLPKSYIDFMEKNEGKELDRMYSMSYLDYYGPFTGDIHQELSIDCIPTIHDVYTTASYFADYDWHGLGDSNTSRYEKECVMHLIDNWVPIFNIGGEFTLLLNKKNGSIRTFWLDGEEDCITDLRYKPSIIANSWDEFVHKIGLV